MDKKLRNKIIGSALLSLFIYALPVLLMFGTFYLKGERPWLKHQHKTARVQANPND